MINDSGDFDYELNQTVKVIIKATSQNSVPSYAEIKVNLLDDRREDFDSDGLSESVEEDLYGTSDLTADTDGDGYDDAYEVGIGRFELVTGNFNWNAAVRDAESKGGQLATFASKEEFDIAIDSLGGDPYSKFISAWIGLIKEDLWIWVDGTELSYDRWANSEPKNNNRVQLFGNRRGRTAGRWYAVSSSAISKGYFLETGHPTDPTKADTDGDGINDKEEVDTGTNPLVFDQFFEGDDDRDGWKNEAEILFGSSPSDPESVPAFKIKIQVVEEGQLEVLFPGEKDLNYTIQISRDMKDWQSLEKLIIGQGDTVREMFQVAGEVRFFRILRE